MIFIPCTRAEQVAGGDGGCGGEAFGGGRGGGGQCGGGGGSATGEGGGAVAGGEGQWWGTCVMLQIKSCLIDKNTLN